MDFPIFNSKQFSKGKTYNLNSPTGRRQYFSDKAGKEIADIKNFLENNSFVGFMLAKKSAGKGTFSKMLIEVLGANRITHISVGDIVRSVHSAVADNNEMAALKEYLHKNYRGYISAEQATQAFLGRSQDKLIPTEFILTLVKREIEKIGHKAILLDGFPRNLDQVSYSLYFRDLINFRSDPDFFALIDVPISVISERMKYRKVCPICQTSRNLKLGPTTNIGFDEELNDFYLICDNPNCEGAGKQRMVEKEGDESGIELIRDRLEADGKLLEEANNLSGIPKIYLRNALPAKEAEKVAEAYEITPEYTFERQTDGSIRTIEKPWIIENDSGEESYSLLPAPVVLSFIKQLHSVLI